jgi:transposase
MSGAPCRGSNVRRSVTRVRRETCARAGAASIAALPELGRLNRREIPALVGVARVACMRKRLTVLNPMVRTDKPWDNSLHRT